MLCWSRFLLSNILHQEAQTALTRPPERRALSDTREIYIGSPLAASGYPGRWRGGSDRLCSDLGLFTRYIGHQCELAWLGLFARSPLLLLLRTQSMSSGWRTADTQPVVASHETRWARESRPEGLGGYLISQAEPAVALGERCVSVCSSSSVAVQRRCCSTIFDDTINTSTCVHHRAE